MDFVTTVVVIYFAVGATFAFQPTADIWRSIKHPQFEETGISSTSPAKFNFFEELAVRVICVVVFTVLACILPAYKTIISQENLK